MIGKPRLKYGYRINANIRSSSPVDMDWLEHRIRKLCEEYNLECEDVIAWKTQKW